MRALPAELLRPRRAALHIVFANEDVVVARIHMPRQGARGVPGDGYTPCALDSDTERVVILRQCRTAWSRPPRR